MGREIRRVPKDWVHPMRKNPYNGKPEHQPMYDEYFGDVVDKWNSENALWEKGEHPDQIENPEATKDYTFAKWTDEPPDDSVRPYYRDRNWTPEEATCYQYYQNVSEGSPLSPVIETLDQMVNWLVENEGHSRASAEAFCKVGWAPTGMMNASTGEMKMGVDAYDIK